MEEINDDLTSMVEILNDLHAKGYTTQFKATEDGLCAVGHEQAFQPEDIEIKHFYRFEGDSSPDDNAVVYAIQSNSGEKGTLVDSYGVYSDEHIEKFIKAVEAIRK